MLHQCTSPLQGQGPKHPSCSCCCFLVTPFIAIPQMQTELSPQPTTRMGLNNLLNLKINTLSWTKKLRTFRRLIQVGSKLSQNIKFSQIYAQTKSSRHFAHIVVGRLSVALAALANLKLLTLLWQFSGCLPKCAPLRLGKMTGILKIKFYSVIYVA